MPNFTNPFPSWGDAGTSPASGFQYADGDQVREDHLDYIWHQNHAVTNNIIAEFERLDSDSDGTVDEADSALTYKGNDIDTDGDGNVDRADNADYADDSDQLDGLEADDFGRKYVGIQAPVFATEADVPTSITQGEIVFIDDQDRLLVEDGT